MSDLLPQMRPHPTDPSQGDVVNASGVIELARAVDTPKSRAFLEAYRVAEADVAKEKPYLSEAKIRGEAVIRAIKALGHTVA